LSHLKRASISSRIALGPRAGLKVRRIGSSFGFEEEIPQSQSYGCMSMNGFSIHAATSIKAHERDRLEKLLRYLGRGPVSHERISLSEGGNILYELKNSYDGASHVMFSPIEFIEKLASIIPPPYRHQVNYYGCLSSHIKRNQITALIRLINTILLTYMPLMTRIHPTYKNVGTSEPQGRTGIT